MKVLNIRYCFKFVDGSQELFHLQCDAKTLLLIKTPEINPAWTFLDFHQCENCSLKIDKHQFCPTAIHLVDVINRFDGTIPHDVVHLDVITKDRFVSMEVTVQQGISALIGLIMVTSGCPLTSFLRPMARFHVVLANDEETLYRVISLYLMDQFFKSKKGIEPDYNLTKLIEKYDSIHKLNMAMKERLKSATINETIEKSIITLDRFTQVIKTSIGDSLSEIKYLFEISN